MIDLNKIPVPFNFETGRFINRHKGLEVEGFVKHQKIGNVLKHAWDLKKK